MVSRMWYKMVRQIFHGMVHQMSHRMFRDKMFNRILHTMVNRIQRQIVSRIVRTQMEVLAKGTILRLNYHLEFSGLHGSGLHDNFYGINDSITPLGRGSFGKVFEVCLIYSIL